MRNMERTFVMLKPDAIQRSLAGEIISRIEKKGFKIVAMQMMMMQVEKAEELYEEHKERDFYDALLSFTMSSAVIVMVIEGIDAVERMRSFIGSTQDASRGTIRGDYSLTKTNRNLIHASATKDDAAREIANFFEDIRNYMKTSDVWMYSKTDMEISNLQ